MRHPASDIPPARHLPYRWILLLVLGMSGCNSQAADYTTRYQLTFSEAPYADARIVITQDRAAIKQLNMNMPSTRYAEIQGDGEIEQRDDRILWRPPAKGGELRYRVTVDQAKGDAYDARLTKRWVLLRLDDAFPASRTRLEKGTQGSATVAVSGPKGWRFESPYGVVNEPMPIDDATQTWIRPKGWLLGGELGTRRDTIAGRQVSISAPKGSGMRRLDAMALLRWTLPELAKVFPQLPKRLLVIGAPEEMWRGGLSAPNSLYLHQGRPLISENGTSTLVHELAHIGGLHSAAAGADWIVEGLAEYYSLLILKRSDTISIPRFNRALASLKRWADDQDGALRDPSNGANTAFAVLVLHELAQELNAAGRHIDQLTNVLLAGEQISEQRLVHIAADLLGHPSRVLQRYIKS